MIKLFASLLQVIPWIAWIARIHTFCIFSFQEMQKLSRNSPLFRPPNLKESSRQLILYSLATLSWMQCIPSYSMSVFKCSNASKLLKSTSYRQRHAISNPIDRASWGQVCLGWGVNQSRLWSLPKVIWARSDMLPFRICLRVLLPATQMRSSNIWMTRLLISSPIPSESSCMSSKPFHNA